MNRKAILTGPLTFALAIAGIVLMLKVLNWVPLTIHKEALRSYSSIEQVRSSLNFRTIYVPSYFPQDIVWPPAKILAQSSPFPAIIMEFTRAGTKEISLTLSQSQGGTLGMEGPLAPDTVREKAPYVLRGNRALLTVGECGGTPCSMVTWTEGGYELSVAMRSSPFELSKLVESMHP